MLAKWDAGHDCGAGGDRNERFEFAGRGSSAVLSSCPQVQRVYYVTGDFGKALLVLNDVRDMAEYEALTRELFFSSGNIKSLKRLS